MTESADAETEQIKRLLPAATGKQVKDFVKKLAQKDPGFRKVLCAWLVKQFVPKGADSADDLKTMVQQMFLSTPKKTIHYSRWESESMVDWHTIAKKGGVLMDSAEDMLKQGNAASAAALAMAFAEQLAALMAKGCPIDESEDALPAVVGRAAGILKQAIASPDVPPVEKRNLLPRLEALAPYDRSVGLHTFRAEELMERVWENVLSEQDFLSLLDGQIAQAEKSYEKEELIMRKKNYLCSHGREAEVPSLMQMHLSLPSIRRDWADYLLRNGRYEEAMQVIEEGIRLHEKAKPGDPYCSVSNWWLFLKQKYAEQHNDLPRIIEANRSLFIECGEKTGFYHTLKKLVPSAEWPAFMKELIRDATSRSYCDTSSMASIYLEEGHEEKLTEMLKTGNYRGLDFICRFAPKLSDEHARPFLEQFRQDIREHVLRSSTRGDYRAMVDYLRRIRQAYGGEVCVAELVAEFRRDYCRRRAMMEELDKL